MRISKLSLLITTAIVAFSSTETVFASGKTLAGKGKKNKDAVANHFRSGKNADAGKGHGAISELDANPAATLAGGGAPDSALTFPSEKGKSATSSLVGKMSADSVIVPVDTSAKTTLISVAGITAKPTPILAGVGSSDPLLSLTGGGANVSALRLPSETGANPTLILDGGRAAKSAATLARGRADLREEEEVGEKEEPSDFITNLRNTSVAAAGEVRRGSVASSAAEAESKTKLETPKKPKDLRAQYAYAQDTPPQAVITKKSDEEVTATSQASDSASHSSSRRSSTSQTPSKLPLPQGKSMVKAVLGLSDETESVPYVSSSLGGLSVNLQNTFMQSIPETNTAETFPASDSAGATLSSNDATGTKAADDLAAVDDIDNFGIDNPLLKAKPVAKPPVTSSIKPKILNSLRGYIAPGTSATESTNGYTPNLGETAVGTELTNEEKEEVISSPDFIRHIMGVSDQTPMTVKKRKEHTPATQATALKIPFYRNFLKNMNDNLTSDFSDDQLSDLYKEMQIKVPSFEVENTAIDSLEKFKVLLSHVKVDMAYIGDLAEITDAELLSKLTTLCEGDNEINYGSEDNVKIFASLNEIVSRKSKDTTPTNLATLFEENADKTETPAPTDAATLQGKLGAHKKQEKLSAKPDLKEKKEELTKDTALTLTPTATPAPVNTSSEIKHSNSNSENYKSKAISSASHYGESLNFMQNIVNSIVLTTSSRADQLSGARAAIAAGSDDYDKVYGVWTNGFITSGKGKEFTKNKHDSKGFVIGADAIINDAHVIGYTYSNARMHSKNWFSNNLDKKIIDANILGLYGTYKISPEFFAAGQFNYGRLNLKSYRQDENNSMNYGKTRGNVYNSKLELGYNFINANNSFITPKIGFSYFEGEINPFNETGQNRINISNKIKAKRLAALASAEVGSVYDMNKYSIAPSLFVGVNSAIYKKNGAIIVSNLDNNINNLLVKNKTKEKTNYTAGAKVGLSANSNYEVDLGYQANMRSKFVSHSGTVKLKIKL